VGGEGIREGVESKDPDVCAILEVRSDWQSLAKTDGFENWLRQKGYRFCYLMWTGGNRTGIGKAGVSLLCKREPGSGWGEEKDLVGRAVRAEFDNMIIVATYHSQGGFTEETLSERQNGRHSWQAGSKK
jgi:exonuclease III